VIATKFGSDLRGANGPDWGARGSRRYIRRAVERSVTMLDVAIGGLAAQPAMASVIAGATSPEQVRANVAAGEWTPTPDDLRALDRIVPPRGR
jgi:aryl-alcohol dehydrogenase-like predicted oxidoreductase